MQFNAWICLFFFFWEKLMILLQSMPIRCEFYWEFLYEFEKLQLFSVIKIDRMNRNRYNQTADDATIEKYLKIYFWTILLISTILAVVSWYFIQGIRKVRLYIFLSVNKFSSTIYSFYYNIYSVMHISWKVLWSGYTLDWLASDFLLNNNLHSVFPGFSSSNCGFIVASRIWKRHTSLIKWANSNSFVFN